MDSIKEGEARRRHVSLKIQKTEAVTETSDKHNLRYLIDEIRRSDPAGFSIQVEFASFV